MDGGREPVTVVVACVAGFGAWGQGFQQSVTMAPTYASELFGAATKLTYPSGMQPKVHLLLKNLPAVEGTSVSITADSEAKVTFSLMGGTFTNVVLPNALMCVPITAGNTATPTDGTAAACATIDSGGGKGDDSVTFVVSPAAAQTIDPAGTADADPTNPNVNEGENQWRIDLTVPAITATGKVTVATTIAPTTGNIPGTVNDCEKDDKGANVATCDQVVMTAKATQEGTATGGGDMGVIHPDDFKMLAPLATGKERTDVTLGTYKLLLTNSKVKSMGGVDITETDLLATMQVTVSGDLNEGDQIMIEGNDPKTMTVSSGQMSVSESVNGVTGSKGVTLKYKPAGKAELSHGDEIKATFAAQFGNASYKTLEPMSRTTTLKISGITGNEVKAYGMPGTENGWGDMANVRVRCDDGAGTMNDCRVFLECWDNDGMGDIGEVGKIAENALMRLDSEKIEMYSGVAAGARHSCRILATGSVAVQALVRDRDSGVLINNTAVSTNN